MKTQYSVLLHNSLMIVLFLPGHSAADSSHYPVKSKNNGGGGVNHIFYFCSLLSKLTHKTFLVIT